MAAALAFDIAIDTTPVTSSPAILLPPAIPAAPAYLHPGQQRAIVHSGELAIAKGLRIVGAGTCRVAGHVGEPVWAVSSASRPHLAHLVWVEHGRIMCDCEARRYGRFTCAHAQLVRIQIVAERAAAISAPVALRSISAPEPTPAPAPVAEEPAAEPASEPAPVAPEDDPEPEPPTPPAAPAARAACPTCGGPVEPAEIEQLGECLNCLMMRADVEREERAGADWQRDEAERAAAEAAAQLPCWACGAPATAETDHGLYCDACVSLPRPDLRRKVAARQKQIAKEETARRVIAREKARERAHTPSEASPRAARAPQTAPRTEAARRSAEKAAKRRPAAEPDSREARFNRALQSIAIMRGESAES